MMLSYMIPGEEKTAAGPAPQKSHLQLQLESAQMKPVLENITITETSTRQLRNPGGGILQTNKSVIKQSIVRGENGTSNKTEKTILKTNNNNTLVKTETITSLSDKLNKSFNDSGVSTGDDTPDSFYANGNGNGNYNSPGSDITPLGGEKPKLKLLANGGKQTTLKRVSFGSSKGSMVETLVFESPQGGVLAEEPDQPDSADISNSHNPFRDDLTEQEE